MGSASDWAVAEEAYRTLKGFGVDVEVKVLSAHRTPDELREYVLTAKDVEVFIAAAGKAAHLPGVIASLTVKPVIGLPVPAKHLYGVDALLSIVQMPPGVPVASVGIGEARNAALLALEILSLRYPELERALKDYREELKGKALGVKIDV